MTIDTFNTLVKTFGDQSYDEADRWKSIKYISTEGQFEPIDFEHKFINDEAYFISDESYGAGFIFMGVPYAEFEPINKINGKQKRIVTFVNIEMVCSLSFKTDSAEATSNIITGGGN